METKTNNNACRARLGITWSMNGLMFACAIVLPYYRRFSAALFLGKYLEYVEKEPRFLLLAITGQFIAAIAVLLVLAWFLLMFWNRFLADVVKVRTIAYREALCIALIVKLLFG